MKSNTIGVTPMRFHDFDQSEWCHILVWVFLIGIRVCPWRGLLRQLPSGPAHSSSRREFDRVKGALQSALPGRQKRTALEAR